MLLLWGGGCGIRPISRNKTDRNKTNPKKGKELRKKNRSTSARPFCSHFGENRFRAPDPSSARALLAPSRCPLQPPAHRTAVALASASLQKLACCAANIDSKVLLPPLTAKAHAVRRFAHTHERPDFCSTNTAEDWMCSNIVCAAMSSARDRTSSLRLPAECRVSSLRTVYCNRYRL